MSMTQNNDLYENTPGESVKSVLKEKFVLSEIFEGFENLKNKTWKSILQSNQSLSIDNCADYQIKHIPKTNNFKKK